MPMEPTKAIERSVDSLQRIYAVIVALAIGQAIQALVVDRATGDLAAVRDLLAHCPAFLSFVVVLVPFYHGMNRHLDCCYIDRRDNERARGALLFDFIVFFAESALLFAVANSIGAGLRAFAFLGILLALDVVWALISHWIHYTNVSPSVARWSIINFGVLVVGLFVGLREGYSEVGKGWVLFALSLTRSVADYSACWLFYFPSSDAVDAAASRASVL